MAHRTRTARLVEGAGAPPAGFLLAAALAPAEARAARDRLAEALTAAGAAGLALELDEGPVFPCALQLVVAAGRSAEAGGTPLRLGPRATAALAALNPEA